MAQVLFNCPSCGFSEELSESDIPLTSKQCKCPKCCEIFDLTEAIKQLATSDADIESLISNLGVIEEKKTVTSEHDSIGKSKDPSDKFYQLLDEALQNLESSHVLESLLLLEEAEKLHSTPKLRSYLAYCNARVNGKFSDGIRACKQAIEEEPTAADHYLNLGRIYMLIDKRGPAIQVFRKGCKLGPNKQLMQEMRKFGVRKPPTIPALHRDHIVNHKLGKLLSRLKFR
ncbi:MAG: hypothetical protein V2I50_10410 [Desulfuromusa sp.]|jgi:tetratricopeptide (TPR) repeat protein|nr:hypothetical protein [Desulfuromusa sp.]